MSRLPDDPTRWSVIDLAARGDTEARSTFARIYLPIVRSFLEARWRATRLAAEVEDAAQEVFVECLRDGGVLLRADRDRGQFRGLLFGVVRNVAARHEERLGKRRARGEEPGAAELATIAAREPSLSVLFDRSWAEALVTLAGERMRQNAAGGSAHAKRRVELLEMKSQLGLPIREIAKRWNEDPDVLHRAYAKGRQEFRTCLREVVAEHVVRDACDLDAEVRRVLDLLRGPD